MCFLIIKLFVDDKKVFLKERFFESNLNFTTEHVKIVKNSMFLLPKLSISRFFHVSR